MTCEHSGDSKRKCKKQESEVPNIRSWAAQVDEHFVDFRCGQVLSEVVWPMLDVGTCEKKVEMKVEHKLPQQH